MLYYKQVNGDEDIVIFAKVYTGSFFSVVRTQRRYSFCRDGQLNLAHGPETKNKENKIKNRVAQKKRSRQRNGPGTLSLLALA